MSDDSLYSPLVGKYKSGTPDKTELTFEVLDPSGGARDLALSKDVEYIGDAKVLLSTEWKRTKVWFFIWPERSPAAVASVDSYQGVTTRIPVNALKQHWALQVGARIAPGSTVSQWLDLIKKYKITDTFQSFSLPTIGTFEFLEPFTPLGPAKVVPSLPKSSTITSSTITSSISSKASSPSYEALPKPPPLVTAISIIDPVPLPENYLRIGDVVLRSNAADISVTSRTMAETVPLMRNIGSVKRSTGHSEKIIEMTLYFYGPSEINGFSYDGKRQPVKDRDGNKIVTAGVNYISTGLRPLLALFRKAPFVPVINNKLNMDFGIDAVSLVSISVSTVENTPNALQVTLIMAHFSYEAFVPDIALFDQGFCYPLFQRYVHQGTIHPNIGIVPLTNDKAVLHDPYFSPISKDGMREAVTFFIASESSLQKAQQLTGKKALSPGVLESFSSTADKLAAYGNAANVSGMVGSDYQFLASLVDTAKAGTLGPNNPNSPKNIKWVTPSSPRQFFVPLAYGDGTVKPGIVPPSGVAIDLSSIKDPYIKAKLTEAREKVIEWRNSYSTADIFLREPEVPSQLYITDYDLKNNGNTLLSIANIASSTLVGIAKTGGPGQYAWPEDYIETYPWIITGKATPVAISASTTNIFANLQTQMWDSPTHQYLGGEDTIIDMTFICDDLGLLQLRELKDRVDYLSRRYRFQMMGTVTEWDAKLIEGGFLNIQNDIVNLHGVRSVLIESLEARTEPNFPGMNTVAIRMISFERTQKKMEQFTRWNNEKGAPISILNSAAENIPTFKAFMDMLPTVEVYPDLELPTMGMVDSWIEELGIADLCQKYSDPKYPHYNSDRRYVDPDFYIETTHTNYEALSELIDQVNNNNPSIFFTDSYGEKDVPFGTRDHVTLGSKADDIGKRFLGGMINRANVIPTIQQAEAADRQSDTLGKTISGLSRSNIQQHVEGVGPGSAPPSALEKIGSMLKTVGEFELGQLAQMFPPVGITGTGTIPGTEAAVEAAASSANEAHASKEETIRGMWHDEMHYSGKNRLIRAFPSFFMCIVDEGKIHGYTKLFDHFYGFNALNSIKVIKPRKAASDVCILEVSNFYKNFASLESGDRWKKPVYHGLRYSIIQSVWPRVDEQMLQMWRDRNLIGIVLTPGMRLHVRMGYGSAAQHLPIVFNGDITEIPAAGEVVEIIAQGDGRELLSKTTAEPNQLNGGYILGTEPSDLMIGFLAYRGWGTPEVFGSFNPVNFAQNTERLGSIIASFSSAIAPLSDLLQESPFGIRHFGYPGNTKDRLLTNWGLGGGECGYSIYTADDSDEVNPDPGAWQIPKGFDEWLFSVASLKNVRGSRRFSTYLFNKTPWDIIKLCEYIAPDFITAVHPFELRSTLFYGKPYYQITYGYDYGKLENGVIPQNDSIENYKLKKPFCQIHLLDSYNDIISNNIIADKTNLYTAVMATFNTSGILQLLHLYPKPDEKNPNAMTIPVYADICINPQDRRMAIVDSDIYMGLLAGKVQEIQQHFTGDVFMNIPNTVAANKLKEYIKDMYQGSLLVIGDPTIKPYDWIHICDISEEVSGLAEVKTVAHHMSPETGMISDISPDLCTYLVNTKIAQWWNCAHWIGGSALIAASIRINAAEIARNAIKGQMKAMSGRLAPQLHNRWNLVREYAKAKGLLESEQLESLFRSVIEEGKNTDSLRIEKLCEQIIAREKPESFATWLLEDIPRARTILRTSGAEGAFFSKPVGAYGSLLESVEQGAKGKAALAGGISEGVISSNYHLFVNSVKTLLEEGPIAGFKEIDLALFPKTDAWMLTDAGAVQVGSVSYTLSTAFRRSKNWLGDVKVVSLEKLEGYAATEGRARLGANAILGMVRRGEQLAKVGQAGFRFGTTITRVVPAVSTFFILASISNYLARFLQNLQTLICMPLKKHGQEWSLGVTGHAGLMLGDTLPWWKEYSKYIGVGGAGIAAAGFIPGPQSPFLLMLGGVLAGISPVYKPDIPIYGDEKDLIGQMQVARQQIESIRGGTMPQASTGRGGEALGKTTSSVVRGGKTGQSIGVPRAGHTHQGLDIFAGKGTPIYPLTSGTVRVTGDDGGMGGWRVWIEGDDGNWIYYAHMVAHSCDNLKIGQRVGPSDIIGQVDNTGNAASTASHVHLEIHQGNRNGPILDPLNFV